MFKVGEYIVHGRNGVCQIEDITHVDIPGADKNQLYYILVPQRSSGSKVYFPVDSEKIITRAVLNRKEVEALVKNIEQIEPMWIDNERQRELIYKDAINSCDCVKLIRIIKTLYERNQERTKQGKKITFVDERYMREAKEILYDEFSLALDIDKDDVEKYIDECVISRKQ